MGPLVEQGAVGVARLVPPAGDVDGRCRRRQVQAGRLRGQLLAGEDPHQVGAVTGLAVALGFTASRGVFFGFLVALSSTAIVLPEGALLRCTACGQFVSQASEERYRRLHESLLDAFAVVDSVNGL